MEFIRSMCPRFQCVYAWVTLVATALCARPYAAIDSCLFASTNAMVQDTAGARDLAEAVNCSGGTFSVEWHGAVVVDVSIAVGQGSTLNITGVGADASVDGNGTPQLFVVIGASLIMSSVQLTSVIAEDEGTAIDAVSSTLVLRNTSFRGFYGGAIHVDGSTVSFSGKTVMNDNYVLHSSGAGIYITDSVVSWSGVSIFFNNTCGFYGCAVYAENGALVSWIGETTFELNTSLYGAGSAVSIQSATNASWRGHTSFRSNTDFSHTGAVFALVSGTLTFVGETLFTNNSGAIQLMVSTCIWYGNTTFSNNRPMNGQAGGALNFLQATVSWSGETHFTNNTSDNSGGALYAMESTVNWSGKTHFSGNMATLSGGAMLTSNSDVVLSGETIFSHNIALGAGGAIYSQYDGNIDGPLLMFAGITSFDDNHSGTNGGAIAVSGNAEVSLWGGAERAVTFTRNSARIFGGALHLSFVTRGFDLTAITFSGNSAVAGGAVYSTTSGVFQEFLVRPVTYDDCLFRDNVATVTGGAVERVAGYDMFMNSSFINNTARSGGGLQLAGTTELLYCEFKSNGAYDEGPAVGNSGYLRNISYVSFADNVLLCNAGEFLDYVEDDDHYDVVCDGCPECFMKCDVEYVGTPTCTTQYEHSKSDGGRATLETLEIEPGYWRATNTSRNNGILACYNEEACEGGKTGSAGYCAQGYTGPYCATCTSGFVETLAYTCQRCLGDWRQKMLATIVGGMVAVAGMFFVMHMVSKGSTEPMVQRGNVPTVLLKMKQRLPLQSLKVIIVTWQILTQFDDVANASYPPIYGGFLDNIAAGVSFDLGWVLSAECFVTVDFHDRLLAATIGPIAVLCLLGGTYMMATWRNSSCPQAVGAVRRKHASAVILLAFLVYSSVSSTVFRMFACESLDDGNTYLRADYTIICDSTKHEALQVYAGLMIVVYPVGIPLFYAFILFGSRDMLKDGERRMRDTSAESQSTASLWKPYKPSRFYYELTECLRRVFLTGVIVFTFPNTAAQVATTIFLAFMFAMVSESIDPYISKLDTWLSRVGHSVVFLTLFLALLEKVDISDEREYSANVFGVVLVVVNISMVLAVILEAVFVVRSSFGTEGDGVREDSLPRKAIKKERRGVGHIDSGDCGEQKYTTQEAPPMYNHRISKSKHQIAPTAVESACSSERGPPPAYRSLRNMMELPPSPCPSTGI